MVTLTTPPAINSVLGGNAPVTFDKLVLSQISFNPVSGSLTAAIQLTSTGAPAMKAMGGSLTIDVATAILTVEVGQLDFFRQVALTGPQSTFIMDNVIRASQNTLESGLISLGVIAGIQTSGV